MPELSPIDPRRTPLLVTDYQVDTLTRFVVLSAVRHAGDLDYRLVVVRDCCADPDAEVHAMLLDIVIAKQAAVVTMSGLAGALPGRSS
jgi:nicotinamidase-related amidase